jgi:hypothetical protein
VTRFVSASVCGENSSTRSKIGRSHSGDYEECRRVATVITDVSDEHTVFIIWVTLMMEACVPPKRPFLQEAHGATSQRTAVISCNHTP